jgi:hypothetical protein
MTEIEIMNADLLLKLAPNNKIMVQHLKDDGSYTVEYVKSINDLAKRYNIPYSTLINLYYICTNKGGGKTKNEKKKYIHTKYIMLLKKMRIFDSINEEQMLNHQYFNHLIGLY